MGEPGKNIPPTQRKLREARKKGDVPKFIDLIRFVSLFSGGFVLLWILPSKMETMLLSLSSFFSAAGDFVNNMGSGETETNLLAGVGNILWPGVKDAIIFLIFFELSVCIPALIAGYLSAGPVFSVQPVLPKLERINPVSGISRIFSPERWFVLFKDIFRCLLIFLVGLFIFKRIMTYLPYLLSAEKPEAIFKVIGMSGQTVFWYTFFAIVPIILIDVIYSKHSYIKRMMMTVKELRNELRETEGDPSIKGRRLKLHREIAMQRMIMDVKNATVVITNPQHIAIALKWDEETMDAPVVVAGGRENIASAIIKEARLAGVPVIENPALARSLVDLSPGEEIPENLYEAVAEVIRLIEKEAKK